MTVAMGMGRIPSVFLSSTCYDLNQVRADLKLFIEQIGFEPILSEYNSFPIDPNLGTVNNCLRVVKERADILVLIVGGRYGSETDSGKSITNLEYIHARQKGIPVYVFVSKSILTMLQLWKDNPDANFNSVVDTPKVFEFVETLCGIDNVWVNGFENALEIAEALRRQFAYLFYDSLFFRKQVVSLKLSQKLLQLKGEAFRLILEKPIAWEFSLFGQVLEDGLKEATDIRRDLKYGIAFGTSKKYSNVQEIIDLIQSKINDLKRISTGLSSLINHALVEAVGAPGKPGDAEHIVYVAEKMVEAYRNAIKWTIDLKSVYVEEEFQDLVSRVSNFSETLISDIENYCETFNEKIEKALSMLSGHGEPIDLDLTFTLRKPSLHGYTEELNRLKNLF